MTQALFDAAQLQPLLDHYGGRCRSPCSWASGRCAATRSALRLHNEVPGITVPEHVLQALEAAGPDAPAVGLAFARELVGGDPRDDCGDLRDPALQAARGGARPLPEPGLSAPVPRLR